MATTNTLFVLTPLGSVAPSANYATLDTIADASTPTTFFPVLDFDTTTAEHADWHVTVPSHYGGGGFTISWKGGTDLDNVGTLQIDVRCVNVTDATILTADLGLDTATAVLLSDTPPTTPINKMNYSAADTLSHANAGSPAVGDRLIIRASRNVATDTNTGDLQLAEILVLET